MGDGKEYISRPDELGNIHISEDVLAVIAAAAATEVEGVVVIADGGDNAVVAQNITEAVQALFGVEAHKIKIMKRA